MTSLFVYQIPFFLNLLLRDFFNREKLRLFLTVAPYTMVGYKRLANVYELARVAEKKNIPGAFVECGVWKGGAVGVLASVAEKEGKGRKTWLFDSFEGLPEPTPEDGKEAEGFQGKCLGPLDDVKELLFSKLTVSETNIVIEKGWFEHTLPKAKQTIGPIAILRLDADWYESTKVALENLYDNVVSDGYVIIDDYGHWEGCRKAVDEFLQDRGIQVELKRIDYTGVYFQKS